MTMRHFASIVAIAALGGLPARSADARTALSGPPVVSRVEIDVRREGTVVVQDINLPRPPTSGAPLSLYIAHGGPAAPRAVDAFIANLPEGTLELPREVRGTRLDVSPRHAQSQGDVLLLGPADMAGVVVRLPASTYRRATHGSGFAVLRIRTLLARPVHEGDDDRDQREGQALVRLGTAFGSPIALGRVVVHAGAGIRLRDAQATLCGPDASRFPLAIRVEGATAPLSPPASRVAPVLAVRHASDSLCVQWLLDPAKRDGSELER